MKTLLSSRQSSSCAAGSSPSRQRQRGAVSLVELMIVLIMTALLSVYANNSARIEADDAVASSTAAYLVTASAALQRYSVDNFSALLAGADVDGFTNPLEPTLAELKQNGRKERWPGGPLSTDGYMQANFSPLTPTRQSLRFVLQPDIANCPGLTCTIISMVCINGALKLRNKFRDDLASVTVTKINALNGLGGRSWVGYGDNSVHVYFSGRLPLQQPFNPVTEGVPPRSVDGVVCAQNVFDSAFYNQFVKMDETRAVTLNNDLSVNNGNLSMISGTDSAGNPCKRVAINPANGRIETYLSGCDQTKPAVSILQETVDGVNVGSIATKSVTSASEAASTWIRGDGTVWVFDQSGNYKAAIKSDGTMFMNNEFKLNTSCNPNQEQALAWTHSVTEDVWRLARCTNGKWRPDNGAVAGSNCPTATPGATAVDSTTSAGLICTNGIWIKTADRIGKYAIQKNVNAVNGDEVPKPACDSVSTPVAVIMPTGLPPQNEVFVYLKLIDQGTYWQVSMTDQTGTETDGTVKLQVSCLYQ